MKPFRYGLVVVERRAEFYRMSARDPNYAKLVIPSLEHQNDVSTAYDLTEAMEKLDTHIITQFMKLVATLSAINAKRRAGKGDYAKEK